MFLGTDRIIYSPGIIVFKTDKNYYAGSICNSVQEYSQKKTSIDVITCAAPYFNKKDNILPNGDLYFLFCRRIRNILEIAIENEIESLILGAFGCGAFNCPPIIVSKAFRDVLLEKRYFHAFVDVIFAVKRSADFCENIEAFDLNFQRFPSDNTPVISAESNKRRFFE